MLLAVTALLELRVQQVLRDPQSHDPLHSSSLSLEELEILSMNNDRAAAQSSLDATLCDWHDGHERSCRDWLKQLIDSVVPLAHELGLHEQLKPLQSILMHGNQAMRWLDGIDRGDTIEAMLRSSISAMQDEEMRGVCVSAERALG